MRFKVELHKDVVYYVRRQCDDADRRVFYGKLERIGSDPIDESESIADIELSRYLLRFFRFGRHIAIFELDAARDRIIVRQCRRPKTSRRPRPSPTDGP